MNLSGTLALTLVFAVGTSARVSEAHGKDAMATQAFAAPSIAVPLSCEGPETLYQWKETDFLNPDDYGHTGNSSTNPNVTDPGGEWYQDGTGEVPDDEWHSNWEEGRIFGPHFNCFGEG